MTNPLTKGLSATLTGVFLAVLALAPCLGADCVGGAPGYGGGAPFVPPDGSVVVGSCPEGGTCAQGTCHESQCFLLPGNADCNDDSWCEPGLVCGALGCCALPGNGSTSCCSGQVSAGVCACTPSDSYCRHADECCSGTCSEGGCVGATGEPCTFDVGCFSSFCDNGVCR
jgi:hypothetical protein